MKYKGLLWFGLLLPQWADAHLVSTRFGEFYAGILHPVTTLEHMVPWLAIGLLGGLQSLKLGRLALILFPLTVLIGVWFGADWGGEIGWVKTLNLLSFLIFGVLVLMAKPLNEVLFIGLITLFGITHGIGNSASDLVGNQFMLYVAGVVTAAYLMMTLLVAASHQLIQQQLWGAVAVRALGSWIAAVGLIYAGFTYFAAAV